MTNPNKVSLAVNTFRDGHKNRYFLVVYKDGVEHCRDVHRSSVISFHAITYKGDHDWGQRIDYVATVHLDVFDEIWYRNFGTSI